jgi:hypothetical protein
LVSTGEISHSESPRIGAGYNGRKLGLERPIRPNLQPTSPDHLAGAFDPQWKLRAPPEAADIASASGCGPGQSVRSAGFRSCS